MRPYGSVTTTEESCEPLTVRRNDRRRAFTGDLRVMGKLGVFSNAYPR